MIGIAIDASRMQGDLRFAATAPDSTRIGVRYIAIQNNIGHNTQNAANQMGGVSTASMIGAICRGFNLMWCFAAVRRRPRP